MAATTGSLKRWIACAALVLAISAAGFPSSAEETVVPLPKPDPAAEVAPDSPSTLGLPALLETHPAPRFAPSITPYAPATLPDPALSNFSDDGALYLVAKLTEDDEPLSNGVVWRVYSESANADGKLELVASAAGGDAEFHLDPGSYLIHTAYGHAGTTSRITLHRGVESRTVVLSAGGLKLDALFSDRTPISSNQVLFDIYETEFDSRGERQLVASNVRPASIIRLNADTYHVVSRYGSVNAVVRADIRVEPGKLTDATVYHNAAAVTLKLVKEEGGEALANTSWSVLTPGGDVVVEATGAFPSFVLASGEYQVVARNNSQNYSRNFTVETGRDREVEVLTSNTLTSQFDASGTPVVQTETE
ncbi:hypothetical protein H2509_10725 [Stappia sp. F7233]|uniref:Carboxypeptidase regulatory-like domain-containing protein n=1 Tax=Stappia albiluteola TaxID=2758565 RepID=A0A839AEP8_9HYPH|nr:hypothetical protein [Stappia albiluteola]MBA5777596.1 hypothetical protein [Stappia albiluteola]